MSSVESYCQILSLTSLCKHLKVMGSTQGGAAPGAEHHTLAQDEFLFAMEMNDSTKAYDLLVEGRIPINERLRDHTPLYHAAQNGWIIVADHLLNLPDIEVNMICGGATALTAAVSGGHTAIVELLLNHLSIQPNIPDREGYTPLRCAAFQGRASMIEKLLTHPDIKANDISQHGESALHIAIQWSRNAAVDALLKSPLVNVNQRNSAGQTPLWLAADVADEGAVEALLRHPGLDLRSTQAGEARRNPFMVAVSNGCVEVAELLKPLFDPDEQDEDGYTALALAKHSGHECMLDFLSNNE